MQTISSSVCYLNKTNFHLKTYKLKTCCVKLNKTNSKLLFLD